MIFNHHICLDDLLLLNCNNILSITFIYDTQSGLIP